MKICVLSVVPCRASPQHCQALVERRRKVVVAGETSRLAREADLKALDEVRAKLKDAEDRQVILRIPHIVLSIYTVVFSQPGTVP